MHEATQRRLLRYSFLAFCVLPTLGVLGWSILWSLPSHTASIERQLRNRLGLVVRIDRVTHPRPAVLRLDHVQLIDPESRQRLAEFTWLEANRTDGSLHLTGSSASIVRDQWQRLWRVLHERVLCQDVLEGQTARFTCDQLVIKSPKETDLLVNLDGTLKHENTSLRADLNGRWQQAETAVPVEISIYRRRNSASPRTEISVNTRSRFIPARLFSPNADSVFADQTQFAGSVSWILNDLSWSGQAQGTLKNVDLIQLIAPGCPHHLEVSAEIGLSAAKFGSAGLERAAGTCVATEGTVGRELLESLITHHLGAAGEALSAAGPSDQQLAIRQLALDWQIDERGLAITGTCPTDESPTAQVAILGESGPLWTGPWHRVVHLEYFVRALIPPEMQDAPVVARRLQHRLPRPAPTLDRPAGTH